MALIAAPIDQFQATVAKLLETQGYWIRKSFKVNVTREEKGQIGKQSLPKPEIDLLALHFGRNELLVLEA